MYALRSLRILTPQSSYFKNQKHPCYRGSTPFHRSVAADSYRVYSFFFAAFGNFNESWGTGNCLFGWLGPGFIGWREAVILHNRMKAKIFLFNAKDGSYSFCLKQDFLVHFPIIFPLKKTRWAPSLSSVINGVLPCIVDIYGLYSQKIPREHNKLPWVHCEG